MDKLEIQNKKEVICPVCRNKVIPKEKRRWTRVGMIMSFYEIIKVCPSRRCGERLL
jgi:hypothetical protein